MPNLKDNGEDLFWKHNIVARVDILVCGKAHFDRSRKRDFDVEAWLEDLPIFAG